MTQRRGVVFGIIFTILGILFLLDALEVFEIAPGALWPVLLIALGIGVLAGVGSKGDESDDNG
jgi:hypothetical protein